MGRGYKIDLTGQKYNRLTVISFNCVKNDNRFWNCLCDCGKECVVDAGKFKSGHTKSCGCYAVENPSNYMHGLCRTKECTAWYKIQNRCYNKKDKAYHHYGGRGIKVCKGWLDSFQSFLNEMGGSPTTKHSIERINNDANYSCGKCEECVQNNWTSNCRWATPQEQVENRRVTVRMWFKGEMRALTSVCRELGIDIGMVNSRRQRGWCIERAVYTDGDYSHCGRKKKRAAFIPHSFGHIN